MISPSKLTDLSHTVRSASADLQYKGMVICAAMGH